MVKYGIEILESSLQEKVKNESAKRAEFTRSFVSASDLNMKSLSETLAKKPFNIAMDIEDDKSVPIGIYNLQKFLKFPETDTANGCDGKFGPITIGCISRTIERERNFYG